jgi:putative chitinase
MTTREQLVSIYGKDTGFDAEWPSAFDTALTRLGITDKSEIAALFGILLYESGGLTHLTENLNYSDPKRLCTVFRSHFPTISLATNYVNSPVKLGNYVYAGVCGNGNIASGDGYKYRGHGPVQLTGKGQFYNLYSYLGLPLTTDPEELTKPELGALSACWYWKSHGCPQAFKAGGFDKVYLIFQPAGFGLREHKALYTKALEVL